jgi:hypothetical protein
VGTEDGISVGGETLDNDRFGNNSKKAVSTKRLKFMNEFEDIFYSGTALISLQ